MTHEKVLDYLGMMLDYRTKMIIHISMIISRMLSRNSLRRSKQKWQSVSDCLFQIHEEGKRKLLPEVMVVEFVHCNAKLLFLINHARPDIQALVSFPTTHVNLQDKDDCFKLKRVLKYLKGTTHLKLKLLMDCMVF